MKTKITNRKSIYSGLKDYFPWICLRWLFSILIDCIYKKNKISAFEDLVFVDYIKIDSCYPFSGMEFTFRWLVGWSGISISRGVSGIPGSENDLLSELTLSWDE
jgi:hypothetical protein